MNIDDQAEAEKRIKEQLLRVVGYGASQFFEDACSIAHGSCQLTTALHLLGHCLREIESSVRELAGPYAPADEDEKNTAKRQIGEATERLSLDDEAKAIWLELAGAKKKSKSKLHALAHRQGLAHARRDDDRLSATWAKALQWLGQVLPRLETRFVAHLDALEDILAAPDPQISRLVNEVPNSPVLLRELFRRLEDPRWLKPLRDKGYFDNAPPTILHEGGAVSFPAWPQLMYLLKVAPKEPAAVAELILGVETDNQTTHSEMAKVACELPPEHLGAWATQEAQWVRGQESLYGILCEDLGACVLKLAETGDQVDAALDLARAILEPQHVDNRMHRLRVKYDDWHFGRLLSTLMPPLISAWPKKAYSLFLNLLVLALDAGRRDGSAPDDYSYIWKLNVTSDGGHDGVLEQLVVTVYRACVRLVDGGSSAMELIDDLVRQEWHVFRRIALALATAKPAGTSLWADEALLSSKYFDQDHFRYEYVRLLQARWPSFDHTQQTDWLARVDQGNDTTSFERWVTEDTGSPPTEAQFDEYTNRWRLKQLWPLKGHLPADRESRLQQWENEFGEPEDALFSSRIKTFTGPVSPITTDDLKGMSAADIATYCKSWTYTPGPDMPPSPLGLARTFPEITDGRLEEFSEALPQFKGVAPAYARWLLNSFEQGIKKGIVFNWEQLLSFLEWVVDQTGTVPATDDMTDTDWEPARGEAAHLLAVACSKKALPNSEAYNQALAIILRGLESSDPTPAEEMERVEHSSAHHMSINSSRGKAAHALLAWMRNHPFNISREEPLGFDALPEARNALDKMLSKEERRLVTHAAVASQLPLLIWMDREWVAANLPKLFDADSPAYRTAAWTSYVCWCGPTGLSGEVLRKHYTDAISGLPEVPELPAYESYIDRLADHLALLLWWDSLKDKDAIGVDLTNRFFEKANAEQRLELLGTLGRSLANEKSEVSDSLIRRFRKLWESRLATAVAAKDTTELGAFGWWFHSGRFEEGWSLEQLEKVWRVHGKTSADMFVLEDLERLAEKQPALTAACLDALTVSRNEELWWNRDHIFNALSSCYDAGDDETKALVAEGVNRLVSKGHLEYRSILPAQNE